MSDGRVMPSSVVIAALNVLWAQCSLHVCAIVSSSTSVGSWLRWTKCCCRASISCGSRANPRSLLICASCCSEVLAVISTCSTCVLAVASVSMNAGVIGVSRLKRSMIGFASNCETSCCSCVWLRLPEMAYLLPLAIPVMGRSMRLAKRASSFVVESVTPGCKDVSTMKSAVGGTAFQSAYCNSGSTSRSSIID